MLKIEILIKSSLISLILMSSSFASAESRWSKPGEPPKTDFAAPRSNESSQAPKTNSQDSQESTENIIPAIVPRPPRIFTAEEKRKSEVN